MGSLEKPGFRFVFSALLFLMATTLGGIGCSLIKTRPLQEMNNTSSALKAAKEVQADVLAPVLYREASEWFLRAKAEYKFKNFELADQYAVKARHLAEQAEFEVIKNGGQRMDAVAANPPEHGPNPASTPSPYPYDPPPPTPFERAAPGPNGAAPGPNGAAPGPNGNATTTPATSATPEPVSSETPTTQISVPVPPPTTP